MKSKTQIAQNIKYDNSTKNDYDMVSNREEIHPREKYANWEHRRKKEEEEQVRNHTRTQARENRRNLIILLILVFVYFWFRK